MEEFFPDEREIPTHQSKQIIKEQGNVEAFEILELSNKVQCQHCHKYVSSGHICCSCGRSIVCTNPSPVIVEQIQRDIRQKFELLASLACFLVERTNLRSKVRYLRINNSRKDVKHFWLVTIYTEKVAHHGLEIGIENLNSQLDGPKKK